MDGTVSQHQIPCNQCRNFANTWNIYSIILFTAVTICIIQLTQWNRMWLDRRSFIKRRSYSFQEIPENFSRDFSETTGIWNHWTISTACDKWHWNYWNLQNSAESSRSGNFLYVNHKQRHDYTIWPRFENPVTSYLRTSYRTSSMMISKNQ